MAFMTLSLRWKYDSYTSADGKLAGFLEQVGGNVHCNQPLPFGVSSVREALLRCWGGEEDEDIDSWSTAVSLDDTLSERFRIDVIWSGVDGGEETKPPKV
ncbi:hypothetical protein NEOLI_002723 [Neolecta irregularis DAH-3]|uniref:Uncharacterized protein n=1 Tax=Neolecta irregularis (strain DAH-3) TaxID=1198029 RepID=A0A1U7LTU0_NEOID|nr:hypothetical protein NEOLI_002723 [Neolecta irregularis DAH-3]|eukprot:OLL25962.1 hypothetical protein NEOLI_002723 [Neolecta irregularis DAH-3]